MTNTKIKLYNDDLIKDNIIITIQEYTKNVMHDIYNKDIYYIDELLNLMVKDEIHVHYSYLIKYGIIKESNYANKIKEFIELHQFEEGNDYRLSEINESNRGDCIHKKEYYFHPDAFGIILTRSKNTKEFSHYYNICQICIKHYSNYQLQMKESEVSRLINKLDESTLEQKETNKKLEETTKKLDIISYENKRLSTKIEELLKNNKIQTNSIENLIDKVDILNRKVDIATDTKVLYTTKSKDLDLFIVFKHNTTGEYYASRPSKNSSHQIIKKLNNKNYKEIYRLSKISKSINIYEKFKDDFKDKFDFKRNDFKLTDNTLTDANIINMIKLTYDNCKII